MAATATAQNFKGPCIWSIFNDLIWELCHFGSRQTRFLAKISLKPHVLTYPQRIISTCCYACSPKTMQGPKFSWDQLTSWPQKPTKTYDFCLQQTIIRMKPLTVAPFQSNTSSFVKSNARIRPKAFLILGKVAGSGYRSVQYFFSIGKHSSQKNLPEDLKETPNNITNESLDVSLNALKRHTYVLYHFVSK